MSGVHTADFTGRTQFNNGKQLLPNAYRDWRGNLDNFLNVTKEEKYSWSRRKRDETEQMLVMFLFSGLFREIVKDKDEYYLMFRHFIELYGSPIKNDITIYRSLSWQNNETENDLGCFWSTDKDIAGSFYNGVKVVQMNLKKGTMAYHLTNDKLSQWARNNIGAYKFRGCKDDEYWIDMTEMLGDTEEAIHNRAMANISFITV